MSLTYTPAGALGTACPDFDLPSVDGRRFSRADFQGPLLVMFICNHCPYVKAVEDRLLALSRELGPRGLASVAICSNDSADHPEDKPEQLLKRSREKNYPFPYLIDESQDVAKAFGAVCTPDLYVYDRELRLAYRGRLDDSWRDPARVKSHELKSAIESVLSHQPVATSQNPSMGCSIKWKKP